MRRCKLKTRQEVKVTGLGGEELSENEESEHRAKYWKQKKRKLKKFKKQQQQQQQQWKDLERQEKVRSKMKVTLGIETN